MKTSSDLALDVQGFHFRYPKFELGPLNLQLEPGRILGLVGPNGAGKSTFLNALVGLNRGEGRIYMRGALASHSDPSWKMRLGYVPETPAFYERFTCGQNLEFLAHYYPTWDMNRTYRYAERFGIDLNKKVKDLSKGSRMSLSLVACFSHGPQLMVLDEPTAGLDPLVRSEVLGAISELLEEDGDRSVILSTHILSDIGKIADEVCFIRDGKILFTDDRETLLEGWQKVTFRYPYPDKLELPRVVHYVVDGESHQVITRDMEGLQKMLELKGCYIRESSHLDLEEISLLVLKGAIDADA